jgi:hypothetical protein
VQKNHGRKVHHKGTKITQRATKKARKKKISRQAAKTQRRKEYRGFLGFLSVFAAWREIFFVALCVIMVSLW